MEVKTIDFYGDSLMVIRSSKTGKIYTGVSYVCKGIGLTKSQKDTQVQNIQNDLILNRGCLKFQAGVVDPNNEILGIEIDYLPLWLAKISITPSMQEKQPEVTQKLVRYQLKAKDVLAEAFLKKPSYMITDDIERAKVWIKEQEEKKKLQLENKQNQQLIGELKPKADYVDRILKNKSLMPITVIAKDYGMSGRALNKLLHKYKVQYRMGEQWLLYSQHQSKGYTHSEQIEIERSDGSIELKLSTQWTQKGRLFIYELLKKKGILPMIEQLDMF